MAHVHAVVRVVLSVAVLDEALVEHCPVGQVEVAQQPAEAVAVRLVALEAHDGARRKQAAHERARLPAVALDAPEDLGRIDEQEPHLLDPGLGILHLLDPVEGREAPRQAHHRVA